MSGTVLKAPATTGTSIKAAAGGISSPSFNPVQSACRLMLRLYTAPFKDLVFFLVPVLSMT